MKKIFSALAIAFLVVGCAGEPASATGTPLPLPDPACSGIFCIKQAFANVDDESFFLSFDVTDREGKVEVGDAPILRSELLVGIYLVKPGEDEQYVFGARLPVDAYVCYTGNDLPWSDGMLATSCGFSVPLSQTQIRLTPGDTIHVELPEYLFEQVLTITD